MDNWQDNKHNVRHYIRSQHTKTRSETNNIRLMLHGISELLEELNEAQRKALDRQRKIHYILLNIARVLILVAVSAVTWYLSN